MDFRGVGGNLFPAPYDSYYANFRRNLACWRKSLPKLNKCPSELEDFFKILQRTITHPRIEPRFQLNSYLQYSFFLEAPLRAYNGLRIPSAAPRDPLAQYLKTRRADHTQSETPIPGRKFSKLTLLPDQTHLTNASNLMRCINSSNYIMEHLEIVSRHLSMFSSRVKRLMVANDLKISDPHSGLPQLAGFCAEINSITRHAVIGTACLATTAVVGFSLAVDFIKDPNALLTLFANESTQFRYPSEDENTYARIKIQVSLDMVVRSYERLGKPGFHGGWSLKTGHNADIISAEEIDVTLMALMDVFLVLNPMCVNLLEVFRVLVHSDCIEKSYLLKVIRSFNEPDQEKLCLTIHDLTERLKKIHRMLTAVTASTHRIVQMVVPNTDDYPVTVLPMVQPSCLDFYNDFSLDLPRSEKMASLRPKSASEPVVKDDAYGVRLRLIKEPIGVDVEKQNVEGIPISTRPSSKRMGRCKRRRSIRSRLREVSSMDVSTDCGTKRPVTRGDHVESEVAIKSIASKLASASSDPKHLSESKEKAHQMSGDTDKEGGVDIVFEVNNVEIEEDLGLQLLFRKEPKALTSGTNGCESTKEMCSSAAFEIRGKEKLNEDMVNNNMEVVVDRGTPSECKFELKNEEPPGSQRFDEILDKITALKKEVSGAKTFEIRREGVFKVYEVKQTESGRQLYELHDAIAHPVSYTTEQGATTAYPPLPHYKHLNYIQKFEDENGNTEVYEDGHIDRFASKLHIELTESELLEANLTPQQRAKALESKEIARYKQIFGGSRTYFDLMEVWERTKPIPKTIEEEEEEEVAKALEEEEEELVAAESHAEYYR